MQKLQLTRTSPAMHIAAGRPTLPVGKQPIMDRKISDPSSCPKVERYPVPSFFEYRIKPRDFDPL